MAFTQRGALDILTAKCKRWNLTDDDKAIAVKAIRDGLASDKPRVRNAALRLMLAMERQNQIDDIGGNEAAPSKIVVEFVTPKAEDSDE